MSRVVIISSYIAMDDKPAQYVHGFIGVCEYMDYREE